MAKDDIIKHQFKEGHKYGKGRPKGAPNKNKTILDILKTERDVVNPITGIEERLNQVQLVALAMLKKALKGDVNAAKWLMENGYGKEFEKIRVETDAPQVDIRTLFNFRDDTPEI